MSTDPTLTDKLRTRLTAAADRPLQMRRMVLNLAAHATGHRSAAPDDWCIECHGRWPCTSVRRAAGPILALYADEPVRYDSATVERIVAARVAAVVHAIEAALDDGDQFTDTPQRPNTFTIWGIRRVLAPFGGKPHRWPFPCVECEHFAVHEDGCAECSCMLSDDEAVYGRDDALDDSITSAVWEEAVSNGEEWAVEQGRATGGAS